MTVMPGPLELWGGVECTVNRVGDAYSDQLERTGHACRLDDLNAIAALGIRTVRYPVLWERTAPRGLSRVQWAWSDERLARMRALGLAPIVGLLHHGSGPPQTSLVDPGFPTALAAYARAVAERYPWVTAYTPINEPLTTARFSALYGHWYPHRRDDRAFARAIVNELRGVALAMQAIREIAPAAQLVQTEDLGTIYATSALAAQAAFENERRWLTFDVFTGRFAPGMVMWEFLRGAGIAEGELVDLVAEAPRADVLGINHYATSDRLLDDRVERYPPSTHGGNGRHRYADVEAARVCVSHAGVRGAVAEAWQRYGRPLAITEAHLGGTREQQLRWLRDVWRGANELRDGGVDIRAVTTWSLFGAFDWHNLITREERRYEPGAFDVRGPRPRVTAVARMAASLATTGHFDHPALGGAGWWARSERLCYPSVDVGVERGIPVAETGQPVLITGASGTLGRAFARICEARHLAARTCARTELDITDARAVATYLDEVQPWAVVNAAGYVRVDDAEQDVDECAGVNALGAATLAAACARRGIAFLTFSSDLVFGGARRRRKPYVESCTPSPLGVYGRSKANAERMVLACMPSALVVRTSAFFGPWDDANFAACVERTLAAGLPFPAARDEVVSPTYVPELVHTSLDLLIDGEQGVWHLANAGAVTWAELARRVAMLAGLDAELVQPMPGARLGRAARRPAYAVLGSERGQLLSSLDDALAAYIAERGARRASSQASVSAGAA